MIDPLGQIEGLDESVHLGFCLPNEMTLSHISNSPFSLNLATTCDSKSTRNVLDGIFENFSVKGHLPYKTSKLNAFKLVAHCDWPTVQETHYREILFTPWAREFKTSVSFFV